jgi:hypothetical protein
MPISPEFRKPNVCVTQAEAEWLEEAVLILRGKEVSKEVRRKAATYVYKVARDARDSDAS